MQTRRTFLKIMTASAAFILPLVNWPMRLIGEIEKKLSDPEAKLTLPEEADAAALPAWEQALRRSALDDIITLSASGMEGRRAGTAGDGKAAAYLIQQLKSLGLKPLGEGENSYAQAFTVPPTALQKVNGRLVFRPDENGGLRAPSSNLIAVLPGEEEEKILLSAHFDHLGIYQGNIYPGANDNASGVGCVLDVMRQLVREQAKPRKTIVVAFWSGEEMGFVGSDYFVNYPTFPLSTLKGVLNADTVANGDLGSFALWAENNNLVVSALQTAAQTCNATAPIVASDGHNSDHISFASVGIPAATLMSKEWLNQNHTPEDTFSIIKPDQLKLATAIIDQAVRTLAF